MRRPGTQPLGGFTLEERIGRGALGEVWKAKAADGQAIALKFVPLPDDLGPAECAALAGLQQLAHDDLVPISRLWFLEAAGEASASAPAGTLPAEMVLALPLASDNLESRLAQCRAEGLSGLPLGELLAAIESAGRAIDFLNAAGRAAPHGDVKPANLLVFGSTARLGDTGLARILGNRAGRACLPGSPHYLAPEVLTASGHGPTSDLYALAITYLLLRTGHLPFDGGLAVGAVLDVHRAGKLDFSRLTQAEQPLVAKAAALKPGDRFPTAAAWIAALREACRPELERQAGNV